MNLRNISKEDVWRSVSHLIAALASEDEIVLKIEHSDNANTIYCGVKLKVLESIVTTS